MARPKLPIEHHIKKFCIQHSISLKELAQIAEAVGNQLVENAVELEAQLEIEYETLPETSPEND